MAHRFFQFVPVAWLGILTSAAFGQTIDNARGVATAYVAYGQLSPQDRERIGKIMTAHPCRGVWKQIIGAAGPIAESDLATFMTASMLVSNGSANVFRLGDRTYRALQQCDSSVTYLLQSATASRFGSAQFANPRPGASEREREIVKLRNILRSQADTDLKACALVRLLQLIPEIHDPENCSKADVTSERHTPTAVVRQSSSIVGELQSATQLGTDSLQLNMPAEKDDMLVKDWADDACESFKQYETRDQPQHTHDLELQVLLGGLRLAAELHEDL